MHHNRTIAVAFAAASLALAGCAGTETSTTAAPETVTETTSATQTQVETTTATATDTVTASPTADAAAAGAPAQGGDAYRAFSAALDHPNQFPFPPQFQQETNGTYDYAVVDITGDGADEILLEANTVNIPSPVKVLYWDGSAVQATEDVLLDGPGRDEGVRYMVFVDPYATGLNQYEATSTTLTHQAFVYEGGRLMPTTQPQETVAGNSLAQENLVAWQTIADRQALANMRG